MTVAAPIVSMLLLRMVKLPLLLLLSERFFDKCLDRSPVKRRESKLSNSETAPPPPPLPPPLSPPPLSRPLQVPPILTTFSALIAVAPPPPTLPRKESKESSTLATLNSLCPPLFFSAPTPPSSISVPAPPLKASPSSPRRPNSCGFSCGCCCRRCGCCCCCLCVCLWFALSSALACTARTAVPGRESAESGLIGDDETAL
mmetsp:Transcript_41124/g.76102  ORF Transcript_41124/g.76102 Transcript_41124/m.76102 type:complete len:201 (-) Transcript_41124:120-722(-)